jgi:hypothetical protein
VAISGASGPLASGRYFEGAGPELVAGPPVHEDLLEPDFTPAAPKELLQENVLDRLRNNRAGTPPGYQDAGRENLPPSATAK